METQIAFQSLVFQKHQSAHPKKLLNDSYTGAAALTVVSAALRWRFKGAEPSSNATLADRSTNVTPTSSSRTLLG